MHLAKLIKNIIQEIKLLNIKLEETINKVKELSTESDKLKLRLQNKQIMK